MRILIIHNVYLGERGGEDTVVSNESKLLKSNGNDVDILYFNNVEFKKSLLKNPLNLVFNFNSYKLVKEKIVDFKPEIIHVHNFFYTATPSIFYAARRYGVKTLLTIHNFRLMCPGGLFYRNGNICELCLKNKFPFHGVVHKCFKNSFLTSFLLSISLYFNSILGSWRKIDRIICLTELYKQKLISSKLNIDESKILIKQNFIDTLPIRNNIDSSDGSLLFVGRLSSEKGIDFLIDLVKTDLFKIEIIGRGPMEYKIIELSKSYPNLKYHGFKDSEFIKDKMKSSKFLIFPSQWYEGMPLVILEALSCSLPIVCTNIDNLNEIIEDRVSGLLFKKNDIHDFMEVIKSVTKTDYEVMKRNAYNLYKNKFTQEHNYKILSGIYSKLLEEN